MKKLLQTLGIHLTLSVVIEYAGHLLFHVVGYGSPRLFSHVSSTVESIQRRTSQ